MSMLRKLSVAATTALLGISLAASPVAAAAPADSTAGLGDSYAAGYGIALPSADNPCARSSKAYPLAVSPSADRVNLACSGALIGEVYDQIAMIPAGTEVVTLTVGGNDVGWIRTIDACLNGSAAQCQAAAMASGAQIQGVAEELAAVTVSIRLAAPGAEIYVTGYPLLFQPSATNLCADPAAAGTLGALDRLAVALNAATEGAVSLANLDGADATYVDVTRVFAGHGLCYGSDSWLYGFDAAGALHPTVAGQRAYARALRAAGA